MKTPRIILFSLFVLLIAQVVYFYPQLPATVPIHFGLNGEADRWAAKSSWLILQFVLVGLVGLLVFGIPKLIEKSDDSFINLPNKDYWLAPERRAATISTLKQNFEYFGFGLLALFNFLTFDTAQTAMRGSNRLSNLFWLYFLGFLGFVGVWTFTFCRKFYKI